jgi:hypothetical protein
VRPVQCPRLVLTGQGGLCRFLHPQGSKGHTRSFLRAFGFFAFTDFERTGQSGVVALSSVYYLLFSGGREPKSRSKEVIRVSVLSVSRFTPAGKSAQFISNI